MSDIKSIEQSLPVLEIRLAFPHTPVGKKWKCSGKFLNGEFQQNHLIHSSLRSNLLCIESVSTVSATDSAPDSVQML